MSKLTTNKSEEIKNWLNSIDENTLSFVDEEESCSSVVDSSVIESSESGEELQVGKWIHDRENKFENILPPMTAISFNNINISNSTNVYLGHVYKVNGNLNINVIQCEGIQQEGEESANDVQQQQQKSTSLRPACLIFPRYRWLAMDPLAESKQISEPVENIVFGYTSTISSAVQARNIGIIRDFQTLNVEAQGFNDIVYNFLIGCDGVVYEGRGWGVEGEHTTGYNHISIGVGLVGNFKRNQPTERALKACKNLLICGVTEGHLSKDYKLLTSCQCSSNANFDALYEAFKRWDNFCEVQNCNDS